MNKELTDLKDNLLGKIDYGLKYGSSKGIESFELYIIKTKNLSINIDAGMINAIRGGQIGVSCRCIEDNRIGFASTSGISEKAINFVITSAKDNARVNQPDERWKALVSNKEIGKEGILDSSVLEITTEEAVKGASLIFKEAKEYDSRIVSVTGNVIVNYGAFAIGNTEGITKSSASTSAFGTTYITASDNGKTKTGFDYIMGRGVPIFEGVGLKGAKKIIKQFNSKSLNYTGQMKVLFDPIAAGQLIQAALTNSINSKSVVEGRSFFADKIGDQVGVDYLNIWDNGQIPEDPSVTAIDAEGYPRRTTKIIENGVLKSFIFNQYYSRILETESTGNANRGGPTTYESIPGVDLTTICVSPGSMSFDNLIEEVENGVLVTDLLMGVPHSNFISGDFSVVSTSSYRIENGEIKYPLEAITIAGNLYRSFNQIISISNEKDLNFIGKIPSIAFSGFTVSG